MPELLLSQSLCLCVGLNSLGMGFFGYTNGEFISVTLKDLQMDMHFFLFSKIFM